MNFIVEIPVANPLRFTTVGVDDTQRASFDQVRFSKAVHATMQARRYHQLFEKTDPLAFQFFSNYPTNTVKVLDCNGAEIDSYEPILKRQYVGLKYRAECRFTSYQGKLFIFFENGVEYTDPDFEVAGESFELDGRLPAINVGADSLVRYSIQDGGFINAVIEDVVWNAAVQAEGYLIDASSFIAMPVGGVVEITYNEKEANLYEVDIDLSDVEGLNFVSLSSVLNETAFIEHLSEPIDVREYHRSTLALKYRHAGTIGYSDIWGFLYAVGQYNTLRIPANHYKLNPAGEVDNFNDDFGKLTKLRAVPYREVEFNVFNVPTWIVDKFNIVFAHDTININGDYWQAEDFGNSNNIDRTDLNEYTITLRQVNDRAKKVSDNEVELVAEFDPPSITAIDYEGGGVSSAFSTNTPFIFSFLNLPAWITCDKETFEDGDELEFTIAENETLFDREITLLATCAELPSLIAEIVIGQNFDDSAPDFIDALLTSILVPPAGTPAVLVPISASGAFEVGSITGYGFTAEVVVGGVLFSASANDTEISRGATVRIELSSNDAFFVDIEVSQFPLNLLISLSPNPKQVGPNSNVYTFYIEALPEAVWQTFSDAGWINTDGDLRNGSDEIHVIVSAIPSPFSPTRYGNLYVQDINTGQILSAVIEQYAAEP